MDTNEMMACLTDIVGVADNGAGNICKWDALDAGVKTAAAISTSGLFMDKLPGGVDLGRIDDPVVLGKIITYGIEARDQAIIDFKNALTLGIGARNKSSKKRYVGNIGRVAMANTLPSTYPMQGIRMSAKASIAGLIKINTLKVGVNGVGTFNVYIGRNAVGAYEIEEVVEAFPVTSIANTWTTVALGGSVLLPLSINGVAQEYHIYWDRVEAGGLSPKDNDIKCSCPTDSGMQALYDFMDVNGIQFSDTSNLRTRSLDNKGRGLSMDVEVSCNSDLIVCREYQNNEIAVAMAYGVYYKAGELWIEKIFKMGDVVRELIANREYLWGKRNHYRVEFDARVIYASDNVDLNDTNCYVCREDKMFFQGIYS